MERESRSRAEGSARGSAGRRADPARWVESQPPAAWMRLLLWGSVLATTAVAVVSEWAAGAPPRGADVAVMIGVLLLPVAVEAALATLTVRVDGEGVRLALGRLKLLRKRIDWSEVESAEAVTYHPIGEFGGWGIRWGRGDRKKRAWTMRGDAAVVLHLRDGVRFYVGSDRPERLLERMRAAAGRGLGPRG